MTAAASYGNGGGQRAARASRKSLSQSVKLLKKKVLLQYTQNHKFAFQLRLNSASDHLFNE